MAKPVNFVDLVIVVSGTPEHVRINIHETLEHAAREALRQSNNTGQAPDDWELRTEGGQLLALEQTPQAAGVGEGQTLFLSPKAGAGG
ncbi:DUF2604 domain-containing protein [Nocardioides sp. MH1]|uniref:DUF2604 domain-containing protein n=1 Tax=Nocardioides sp. MH1 TaxID=3242490 RepID=UPI003521C37F